MKVKEFIQKVIQKCGLEELKDTCDQIIEGSGDVQITGIVTTFMATVDVIEKARRIGANFIITHEPTYFTGDDRMDWISQDSVYLAKKALLNKYGITVWRFHDHMHRANPDGIYRGMVKELGWENCQINPPKEDEKVLSDSDLCYEIPDTTVGKLTESLKQKLGMKVLRFIGDPDMKVKRVGLLVGGGSLGLGDEAMPMKLMEEKNLDVLVCGEVTEWTTCAYIRDAVQLGQKKAMIIPGHNRTEEAGMKYLPEWLTPIAEGLPVTFVEAGEPFQYS